MSRRRSRHRKRAHEAEVNVLPVMNLFLVLIPFLLLTAVFAQTAIFEFSLPAEGEPAEPSSEEEPEIVAFAVGISRDGLNLVLDGVLVEQIPRRAGQAYDFSRLTTRLVQIKRDHPQIQTVVLIPADDVLYEDIVEVMSRCNRSGFTEIAFSGGLD